MYVIWLACVSLCTSGRICSVCVYARVGVYVCVRTVSALCLTEVLWSASENRNRKGADVTQWQPPLQSPYSGFYIFYSIYRCVDECFLFKSKKCECENKNKKKNNQIIIECEINVFLMNINESFKGEYYWCH